MEKVSLTFKGTWNGVEVKGYRAIGELKKISGLYEHYNGADIVKFIKGQPLIRKPEDIAIIHLKQGRGVIYKDYVMFIEGGEKQEEFHEKFMETKAQYEGFLDGKIEEYILDLYNVPVLKYILTMFKNKLFSEKIVREKLNNYILPQGIDIVFNEFVKEKEGQ